MEADPYNPNYAQQQHMVPLHAATYHSADGTQAFAVDEFGRHWQLPPAPKLTSAAPRGWNYPLQDQASLLMPYTAPWAVPLNPHQQSQHFQQAVGPQQHYEIEQQMMLHHQMSKQQNRRSVPQLPLPRSQQGQRTLSSSFHYPLHNPASGLNGSGYPNSAVGWQGYGQQPSSLLPSLNQNNSWTPTHAPPEYTSSTASYAQRDPALSSAFHDLRQMQSQQGHVPRNASYATMYNNWQGGNYQSAPLGERRPSLFGEKPSGTTARQDWPWSVQQQQVQDYDDVGQRCFTHHGAWDPNPLIHVPGRCHSFSRSQSHSRSQWDIRSDHHLRVGQQLPAQQDSVQQQQRQETAATVPQETADRGLAPPSPSTLDRSGVSLSSFGAEIIWHSCIGLLEPHLIVEAHRNGLSDGVSPCSTSTLSSPMLGTPLTTPRSPSSGGKDLDASARLLSSLGLNHAHSCQAKNERQDCAAIGWPACDGDIHDCSVRATELAGQSAAPESVLPISPTTSSQELPSSRSLGQSATELSSPMQLSLSSSPCDASFASRTGARSASRNSLGRTKSQERSRAAILLVLGLVSPRWQWTHADATLPTLCDQSQKSFGADRPLDNRGTKTTSPRDSSSSHSSSNSLGSEISPAFRRFAHQVLAQTLLSPTAFLLGLLYALRVSLFAVDQSGNVDPEALEVFASPPSAAPFKLFTLGLMIANKHLDDNTFLNKTWNEVTGIPLAELNKMEQYYLIRCNYEIALPDRVWSSFLRRVKKREEGKIVAASLSKVPSHHPPVGYGRGSTSTVQGSNPSTRDETSQKVLSAIADMLAAVDAGTGFDPLDLPATSIRVGEERDSFWPVPPQYLSSSGEGRLVSHQPQRPTGALVDHHQCQSAPAGALQFKQSVERPSQVLVSRAQPQRPVYDSLARSLSEFATASSSSSSSAVVDTSSRPPSRTCPRFQEAPLAPSALLELLNSGRSLTSAH